MPLETGKREKENGSNKQENDSLVMVDIKWDNLTKVLERYADAFIKNAEQNMDKNDSNASGALQRSMNLDKWNLRIFHL